MSIPIIVYYLCHILKSLQTLIGNGFYLLLYTPFFIPLLSIGSHTLDDIYGCKAIFPKRTKDEKGIGILPEKYNIWIVGKRDD